VRNQNLGFEVPYRSASTQRRYLPDFIVNVDDGHGHDDLLHLIIEVKGFRGEDAKDKKNTMDAFWIPGVNNLGGFGRWAFAEFTDVYTMGDELDEKITESIDAAIDEAIATDQAASAPATS
jgi:type III restriction enzyme